LAVQGHDTTVAQLEHRRAGLPELARIAEATSRRAVLADLIIAARTQISDLEREVTKAEVDVEQVRSRYRRDEQRLASGQGAPKELEQLQHELVSLARRQSELEEVELEIMERVESAQAHLTTLAAEDAALDASLAELTAARDREFAVLDAEIARHREERARESAGIDAALVELYEKVRAASGGVGASLLKQRRCEGCRLELNAVDLERIRATEADEVVRCEECRRILVRTGESGL
jgi:predicted  nucleic acid-binding Zn-ribbon protein